MQERRKFERVQTNLEVRWEELPSGTGARAIELGAGGCFVESTRQPDGPGMTLAIRTPARNWAQFTAEIVYRLEHGFGIRFTNLTQSERSLLTMMIDYAQDVACESEAPHP